MNLAGVMKFDIRDTAYNITAFHSFVLGLSHKIPDLNVGNVIFVMDNFAFHKATGIRSIIESTGNVLFLLPPYSPFLNPIEQFFSKRRLVVKVDRCLDQINYSFILIQR